MEVYWVTSTSTDMGKTYVSTALIKALKSKGIPTVGFKPYGASILPKDIKFFQNNYPSAYSRLFGEDAMKLAAYSDFTNIDDIDVIDPVYLLSFGHGQAKPGILCRVGSELLGDVEYYIHPDVVAFYNRPDIKALVDKFNWPIDRAIEDTNSSIYAFRLLPNIGVKTNNAFKYLVGLGAEAVVCEGAGARLPTWEGSPVINKVFLIDGENILYYKNANLRAEDLTSLLPSVEVFIKSKIPDTSAPYQISLDNGEAMQKTLLNLLD